MADKSGDMLDIVRDILLNTRLDDKERFKQVGSTFSTPGFGACQLLVLL